MIPSSRPIHSALQRPRHPSGSVIVIGLLLLAMVTLGLAAWISLITTRSYFVEQMEASVKRRVAYNNAHALAREYIYQNALAGSAGGPVHVELSGGMGGIDIPEWTGAPLASNSIPGGVNRIGPADGFGFTSDLDVAISDGTVTSVRTYQMRSRSPMLGGDLLCYQNPSIDNTDIQLKGNLYVYGRTQVAVPGLITGYTLGEFRSTRYNVPNLGTTTFQVFDTVGAVILPSNFPSLATTAGIVGGSLGYDGRASTVHNADSPFNSIYHKVSGTNHIVVSGNTEITAPGNRGVVCDGNGAITVDLNDETLTSVLLDGHVRTITLNGQDRTTAGGLAQFDAAENLPAVALVLLQDSSSAHILESLRMNHSNNRRLVMAMKVPSGNSLVDCLWMNANANRDWRMFLVGENMRFRLSLNQLGTVTMKGGIRNDRRIEMDTGVGKTLRLVREMNPQGLLEALLDRNAWLESYDEDSVPAATDPFADYNAPYVGPGGTFEGGGSGDDGDGGGDDGGSGGGGDSDPPTIILSTSGTDVAGAFSVDVSASENVAEVDPSDFLITNGTIDSVAGSGAAYVISVNPTNLGPVEITMAAGTVTDASGNANPASNTLTVSYVGPITLFNDTFNTHTNGWSYSDDVFRGTSQPNYAIGGHSLGFGADGTPGVQVFLGGVDNAIINNMSGGWRRSFTLNVSSEVEITFSYNLIHGANHESDEYGDALISLNGNLVYLNGNDYLARFHGDGNEGPDTTTGWLTLTLPLGVLPAGTHTIALGGFLNRKTWHDEPTTIRFDNVQVTATYP